MMLSFCLLPCLSHWWNHMVPALTRDEFPQCGPPQYRQVLATSMDTWYALTHSSLTGTHSPTYTDTQIHSCTHAHDTHTCPHGMQNAETGWSCVALKQTRELSVHETGLRPVSTCTCRRSFLLGRIRMQTRRQGKKKKRPSTGTGTHVKPCLIRLMAAASTHVSSALPPNRMASPSAGSSEHPFASLPFHFHD